MSDFTAGMQTALAADTPVIFGAIKIEFPGYDLCLIGGSGVVSFGGDTFVGRDETFGVLTSIDALDDGVGDQAPALSITLQPTNDTAADILANSAMQGSPVSLWLGAITRATGVVIPDPLLLFYGELDQPTLRVGKGQRTLEYECVSAFERLFDLDEGFRLADSFHQMIWPGEDGLANVTGVTKKIYWGTEGAGGSVSTGGGSSGGGGGFSVGNVLQ